MHFSHSHVYSKDWGSITAEGYNASLNEVTLIFNLRMQKEIEKNNAIQYVVGRLCYGALNFPSGVEIRITFDIRGQEMILSRSKKIKEELLVYLEKIGFENRVSIDFLS